MIEIILAASSYPSINLVLAQHFGPIYTLTQLSETDYSGYQNLISYLFLSLSPTCWCGLSELHPVSFPHLIQPVIIRRRDILTGESAQVICLKSSMEYINKGLCL